MQGLRAVVVCTAIVLGVSPVFAKRDEHSLERRSMANTYGGRKLVIAEVQRKHCRDLAVSCDLLATQSGAMAAHEAEAKR